MFLILFKERGSARKLGLFLKLTKAPLVAWFSQDTSIPRGRCVPSLLFFPDSATFVTSSSRNDAIGGMREIYLRKEGVSQTMSRQKYNGAHSAPTRLLSFVPSRSAIKWADIVKVTVFRSFTCWSG